MALHTVWGTSAPPGTYSYYTDASPDIWTAMGFHRTIAGTPVEDVVGARLYVTAAALAANSSAQIRVFRGGQYDAGLGAVQTGWASPIETKTLTIGGVGWNEVMFDSPVACALGERIYIAVQYGGNNDAYQHSGSLSSSPTIGAEGGWGFGFSSTDEQRAVYTIGGGSITVANSNAIYGLDIIFDDGAAEEDTEAPSVPAGVNVTDLGARSATINWTASTDNIGVTGYEVQLNGVVVGLPTTNTFAAVSLIPETTYTVRVRARDSSANWSALSTAVDFTTEVSNTLGMTMLETYNGANSTSHVIDLAGAITGRDTFLLLVVAATTTVASPWTTVESELVGGSAGYLSLYRLDESETPPANVTVTLNGARNLVAFVWQDDVDEATIYATFNNQSPTSSTSWGTGNHTFAEREVAFAVYGVMGDTLSATAEATSFNNGYALVADSGYTAGANERAHLWLASKEPDTRNVSGITLTGVNLLPGQGGAGMFAYTRTEGPDLTDTTPPSVPTGLSIGTITTTSAIATWTASTDDVAVTGYEVFKDGVSAGTTSSTTFNLTGLSASTEYDITVRARDAAANWSAQTAAETFTTNAAPTTGGRWINHVVIRAPQNGTNSHTVGPSSGDVAVGTLFTPTAGRFLVCVVEGAVTSGTPTGWTLPSGGSAINNTGLYVWHRTAAGGDSLSTTHNASNYPVLFHFFEFAAGTAFIGANFDVNILSGVTGPTLTGLTGTNLIMYAVGKGITETTGTRSYTWSVGEEIADVLVMRPGGSIDGYHYGLAISEDFTGSTASSAATTAGSLSSGNHERLIFALSVMQESTGDEEAPSVPTNVQVTPGSVSAAITWDASTDNVGVTSYEVSIDGTPVGTPTATTFNATGLTPETTYDVTVRARDSAANWSASTTAVEFTTLVGTRLTIAEENALPGTAPAFWYELGGAVGDTANVGYARTFSNEVGTTVEFCCTGGGVELQIYRLGWYGGDGARLVDTVTVTPLSQAAGTTIPSSNNGIQFSAWTVNASWDIPELATSGFYLGVYRNAADNNASWIPFVVKDAARDSDIVYKTSDATWMIAYNHYGGPAAQLGGGSFYGSSGGMGGGGITSRAHACSYHRPYVTKSGVPLTAFTNAELPMIRWIERMGYEVKYVGCMDLHDSADCLDGASVFVSNGHDEYWSTEMRDNVEAFRDAGGHLLFASGNEVFWRIRRDGIDPNIIWCFKDTMSGPGGHTAGTPLDPVSWTGTWKDTRWGSRRPENLTTGTDFRMNAMSSKTTTFLHTADYAAHPVWRNSALAAGTSQSVTGIVGFEADEMLPARPEFSVVVLAEETYNIDDNRADDNGESYNNDGTLNWGVVAQRYPSGAVVVGFGTVQWSWGLDALHDATNSSSGVNLSMQQMTYNLLRDLGAVPGSPHAGITTSAPAALDEYGTLLVTSTRTVTSSWSARVQTTKSVAASWAVKITSLRQVASSWSALQRVAKTVPSSWGALQRLAKTVSSTWGVGGVLVTMTKTLSSSWAAKVRATTSVVTSWSARAQITKAVQSSWVTQGITYTMTKTLDAAWAARVRVTGVLASSSWSTLARLVRSVVARWRTDSDIPAGDDEPIVIVLSRRPGGRAARSISLTRRRR